MSSIRLYAFVPAIVFCLCVGSAMAMRAQIAPAQEQTAPAQPQPSLPHVIRVSGGVVEGLSTHSVLPIYPEQAKQAQIEGSVLLDFFIKEDGTVGEIHPLSGPEIFQQATVDAAKQWTYKPYSLNGKPLTVETHVMVTFSRKRFKVSINYHP
jgi:TonB family protein